MLLLLGKEVRAQSPNSSLQPTATAVTIPAAYNNATVNYVRTWTPSMPTTDTAVVAISTRTLAEVKQVTQYFDGLGRPIQTVAKGISPAGGDLVTPVIYDAYGREQYKYLPYIQQGTGANDGNFKNNPFNSQATFYKNRTLNPALSGDTIYYGQIEYEASPLNRVLKTYAVGNSWAKEGGNRPVQSQYLVNTVADSVRIWNVTAVIPTSTSVYAAGTLYENVTIDEASNQVVEYKDKEGRVVLKKVQLSTTPGTAHVGWLCTYYVYDDLGNLRFVIPPRAVELISGNWTISTDLAAELCFAYRYDGRNRMIIKKVPGADSTEMVYDVRDRLVFSRDGNLKSGGNWLTTFYDNLNRPIMTALYRSSQSRDALQTSMNTAVSNTASLTYTFPTSSDLVLGNYDGSSLYQATNSITMQDGFDSGNGADFLAEINTGTNNGTTTIAATNPLPGIVTSALTPLTYTFYDDYSYTGKLDYVNGDIAKPQAGSNPYAEALPASASTATRGLVTGTRIRVLETNQWLTTSTYYNDKGRVIQTVSANASGGKDVLTMLYDFSGKVLSTYLRQTNQRSGVTPQTTLLTMNQYDAAGRLLSIKKRLNDNTSLEKTIEDNVYDELGQLKTKRLGVNGSSQLETLNYEYNIRGWLKGINKGFVNTAGSTSNWFGQELCYDYGFSANQYNGNIAGIKWKSGSDGTPRAYGYSYDRVNRVTVADFNQQNTNGANWTRDKVDFSVSGLGYDANGNILSMTQKGMVGVTASTVDQLTYTYRTNSNKLMAVADPSSTSSARLGDFINGTNSGNDYKYDTSGNLIQDLNKGIASISYNHLNLPDTIIITGKGTITYLYDAAGSKLRKTVTDNTTTPAKVTTTDYLGSQVYSNDTLQLISHEDGRIRTVFKTGQPLTYAFDYFVKDHLGNIRMVLGTQSDANQYAATMESATGATENALFSNIDNTRAPKPVGYPVDGTTNPNDYVAKLNATNGQKIGPSLVLRVMAGDTIQLGTKAFYKSTAANTSATTSSAMLSTLLSTFSGGSLADGVHNATGAGSPIATTYSSALYDQLKQKDPSQNLPDKPKAYLSYVLFDDRFNLVDENSGLKQVQGTPDALQTLATDRMVIKKTGFVYIYTSNESGQDVFFDNLVVAHSTGPVLEETHYYPFGLTMAGISSNALKGSNYPENRKKFNGNELQSKEFGDGSGLEWYDFNARTYDQQIGRFMQIDPLIESGEQETLSPYHFAKNDPIKYNDPDGKCPNCLVGAAIGGLVDAGLQLTEIALTDKKLSEFSFVSVAVSAGAGAISSGISSIAKIKQASTIIKIGVELATDAGVSTGSQLINNGEVSLKKTVIDVAAGQLIGRGVGALVEKKAASSVAANRLKETINREKNIARGKSNTVSKVKAKVAEAEKKLDDYISTRAGATAATASGATSTIVEKITEKKKKE
ncbi:DUF6443 domain-containing protein [Chitinophaga polysaccharea]|nr:DUF6443 domain-containing protein [Chitinophaga polysaccharea]